MYKTVIVDLWEKNDENLKGLPKRIDDVLNLYESKGFKLKHFEMDDDIICTFIFHKK